MNLFQKEIISRLPKCFNIVFIDTIDKTMNKGQSFVYETVKFYQARMLLQHLEIGLKVFF